VSLVYRRSDITGISDYVHDTDTLSKKILIAFRHRYTLKNGHIVHYVDMEAGMRKIARILLVLLGMACCQTFAKTQNYPTRPVTIIVPYAAGGATDLITRSVAQRLSKAWGQPVIIENKTGASTQIGAAHVSKSAPDGYTLLATDATTFTNSYLYNKLTYDPAKDFVPVSGLGVVHQALVVHPSFPARNVLDLIKLAKARPDSLNYATMGIGTSSHLSMEMFESMTGTKLNPVHYKGGAPALTDVVGGHVPIVFLSTTLTTQPANVGELRILGVGSTHRLAQFPDLPTVAETVPGYESVVWFGLFAPRGTAREIVVSLNSSVQTILNDQDFRDTFLKPNYYEPLSGSADQFAEFVRSDSAKWGMVMRDAKLNLD
jgi:tripartite-type tricarboxylate transporter receptor subunit TctC